MDDDVSATERDPDLVTLEGLESELAELDADLARAERAEAEPDDGPSSAPTTEG